MPPPNIQFQQLPAEQTQTNPRQFFSSDLERNQGSVKQQYKIQWEMLRKTSKNEQQFRQNVNQLIAKTDMQMQQLQFKHKQRIAMLDQIEELTNQGLISSQVGQRAIWETAGFKIPQQQDWRTEHGKIVTEINRIQGALNATESRTGKAMFPMKDVKFGPGKQLEYEWDKMPPEKAQHLEQLLNAKNVLLQQERSIYEKLPQLEQKAKALQTTQFRRQRRMEWSQKWHAGFKAMPKWFAQGYDNKPVGFTEKIIADMPTARQPPQKKLTRAIARQYFIKYGNRQAAMEAAEQDGYSE